MMIIRFYNCREMRNDILDRERNPLHLNSNIRKFQKRHRNAIRKDYRPDLGALRCVLGTSENKGDRT